MDRAIMGEIAIKLLKYKAGQEGVKLNSSTAAKIVHAAKAIGEPANAVAKFYTLIFGEMVTENITAKVAVK